MTNLVNNLPFIAPAAELLKAVGYWDSANKADNKGDAYAIHGLAAMWDSSVLVDDGDLKCPHFVHEYAFDLIKADGKADTTFKRQLGAAIMHDAFGLLGDEAQAKHKMNFIRAYRPAAYIANTLGVWGDDNKGGVKVGKDGCLSNVPLDWAIDMFKSGAAEAALPDDADQAAIDKAFMATLTDTVARMVASEQAGQLRNGNVVNAETAFNALCKDRVACDGSVHPFYGKLPDTKGLRDRLTVMAIDAGFVQSPKGRNGATNKPSTMVDKIKEVTALLDSWLSPEGESDVAPTKEQEELLWCLQDRIASYFVSNPRLV